MSKYSRELKKKKMTQDAIKMGLDPRKMTKEGFLQYLEKYVDFIGVERSVDGTEIFLNVCGYDGGDVQEKRLERGPRYDHPEEIDAHILEAVEAFKDEVPWVKKPQMSFTQFCKL